MGREDLRDVEIELEEAAEHVRAAARYLERDLPEGTLVRFKCGNMVREHEAIVLATTLIFLSPRVWIQNQETGVSRWIPMSAIQFMKAARTA